MNARKITNEGFLEEFLWRHEHMQDRPFCWVLGSGASVQSGIPTGARLAARWLAEMHVREDHDGLPIDEWATAERLDIPGFEYSRTAGFYPWIYRRRFRDYKEEGYAYLENEMDRAEPSFGYSVLAQIMATTPHKVAVTTNFDNLIADALSVYTRVFPLVCGHESLTGYIRPNLRRPLVAKIHRDLLLEPFSDPDEIAQLPEGWNAALRKVFERFTPIVIGYGGNDGSLMGFLEELLPIEGGIFWCYREGDAVDPRSHAVVEHHHGKLVPIVGFDEVMLQLQEKLELEFLLPQLQNIHDTRVQGYRKQFEELTSRLRATAEDPAVEEARGPVRMAAEAAVERLTKEKNWWAWQLKAEAESDPVKQEAIYRAGLEDFPDSAALMSNFASFMYNRHRRTDEVERLFRRALSLNPDDIHIIGNMALFMQYVMKDFDEAERLYRRAVTIKSDDARSAGNFAQFLHEVRKEYDEAELLYRRAIALDPGNAVTLNAFAVFMEKVKKDNDEAEILYARALICAPENVVIISNLAQCMSAQVRVNEAAELADRAWRLLDAQPSSDHADVAFTRWLLDRVAGGDGAPALGRLKALLGMGFERSEWTFEPMLEALLPRIPEAEQPLARKLADAILHESKVAALDDEPLWSSTEPIPLDAPWPTAQTLTHALISK